MNPAPGELQKLLQHIDQLIAQAPDDAARAELQRLRERLDTPEMLDMARELARSKPARSEDLVLEFHDPLVPSAITALGCLVAAAVCLWAVIEGFESRSDSLPGGNLDFWIMAAFAGACCAMFTALSFARTFSVRFDTRGM